MSEIKERCPYCKENTGVELEGAEECETYTEKCEHCGKKFDWWVAHSIDVFFEKRNEENE